jgi:hypothetical protein
MQRVALAKCCFAEPEPRLQLRKAGPRLCSAPLRKCYALRCVRGTKVCAGRRSRTCECIPIPVPRTSLILLASCPMKVRFLEAILQRTERKLAGPGRPGTVDDLVAGGALGGAAPSLGRARCLAARGGFTTCLKGAHWCPGASHRSIASRGSRGTGKPRTLCAARTRKLGCLKFNHRSRVPGAVRHSSCRSAEPGPYQASWA